MPDNSNPTDTLNAEDFISFDMQDDTDVSKRLNPVSDSVEAPTDSVEVRRGSNNTDSYPEPDDFVNITKTTNPNSGIAKRIPISSVTTEELATNYFVAEVRRRFRFNLYDNMIDPLEASEIEDALYDSLEEINQTPPFTSYTLLSLAQRGSRYRRVVMLGAAKYCLLNLSSIWAANGINVSIEDMSVDNKTGDINSLYSTVSEQYQEALTQMKEYDKLAVSQTTFSTGSRRYGNAGNFTNRVNHILRNGGRLG